MDEWIKEVGCYLVKFALLFYVEGVIIEHFKFWLIFFIHFVF